MGAFKKYLASDIIEACDIPGYHVITEPHICQSCISFDNRNNSEYYCNTYDVEVHPYGSCPKWRERRG